MPEINPYADENGNPLSGKEEQYNIWNKKREKFIAELEEHIKCCKDAVTYSITRFDILIISLSSGALGFSISYIKDITQNKSYCTLWELKLSWILFGLSLIMNLVSQATSYYANKIEIEISKGLMKVQNKKIINHENLDKRKTSFDKCTVWLNGGSLFSFILGIIFLIVFTLLNF